MVSLSGVNTALPAQFTVTRGTVEPLMLTEDAPKPVVSVANMAAGSATAVQVSLPEALYLQTIGTPAAATEEPAQPVALSGDQSPPQGGLTLLDHNGLYISLIDHGFVARALDLIKAFNAAEDG